MRLEDIADLSIDLGSTPPGGVLIGAANGQEPNSRWVWASCVWTGEGLIGLIPSAIAAPLLEALGNGGT
jgi:hypothetical protein